MTEHIRLLQENGLPVPAPNPHPRIVVENERRPVPAG